MPTWLRRPAAAQPPAGGSLRYWIHEQNNSGGVWQLDPARGLAPIVYVQAPDPAAADQRLLQAGAYFDGVELGRDCPCCGDRWMPLQGVAQAAWTDTPRLFGFDPQGRFCRPQQYLRRCSTQYLRLLQLLDDIAAPPAAILLPDGQVQLFVPPRFHFVPAAPPPAA